MSNNDSLTLYLEEENESVLLNKNRKKENSVTNFKLNLMDH